MRWEALTLAIQNEQSFLLVWFVKPIELRSLNGRGHARPAVSGPIAECGKSVVGALVVTPLTVTPNDGQPFRNPVREGLTNRELPRDA